MNDISFKIVSEILQEIEKTASRNEMTEKLSSFYTNLSSTDAQILSYLVLGRISPPFVPNEFNYSEKSFLNLLQGYSSNVKLDINIKEKRVEVGDIGRAVEYFSTQCYFKSKEKTLLEVYDLLWSIMNISGTGSVDRKNTIILDTLKQLSPIESKYFSRIICGELRLGINSKTLLDVFSFVISKDKSLRKELDRAYGVCTDIGYICSCVIGCSADVALSNLRNISLEPGIPVCSRLVERVGSFEEVFERFTPSVLVQPKFDGLRCQIHKFKTNSISKEDREVLWRKYLPNKEVGLFDSSDKDVEVKLFTRNLEDVTEMFPEIVQSAKDIEEDSFILDSETLGFNDGKFLPFQETMQRRRKYDVSSTQKSIPVKAMTFDILYLNGKDLSEANTSERIDMLSKLHTSGGISICPTEEISDLDSLTKIFEKNVDEGYEGIIVKSKEGKYLPGVRNYEWIKLKKSMVNVLVDTIDLVAVGYYNGSGRRSDLGVGAVLGALYNEDTDSFEAICKVGTGFTDEMLKKVFNDLKEDVIYEKPKNVFVEDGLKPDIWVYPKIVFTVEADEITKRITKGGGTVGGGLSLRFPRLTEWSRDKLVTEATTVTELKHMMKKH